MSQGRGTLLAVAALVFWGSAVEAQTPSPTADLVSRAITAYDDLDFGTTAGLIRRALGEQSDTLTTSRRLIALTYLGAAELYRDRRDSALSAFGQIVRTEPRYQPDELIFPPEVTAVFSLVRRDTKVVHVELPDVARLRSGSERYVPQLFASSYHEILVSVTRSDGRPVRVLYGGLIGDSLEVVWDGLDSTGLAVSSGRYVLAVQSRDREGAVVRIARVPLEVLATSVDTVPHPLPPADSLLLPERTGSGPGIGALLGGVVGGVGVALLSSSVAPGAELSSGRFIVGGAMTIGGVVGFFRQRPGRPIQTNIVSNDVIRNEWRARRDAVAEENRRRRLTVDLEIRAGQLSAVDLAGQ